MRAHVDVEHQLGNTMKVSVAYVGGKSDRLDWTGNANAAQFASPLLNSAPQTSPQGVTSCGPKPTPVTSAYTACAQAYYTAVDKLRAMPWGRSDYHYSTSTGYANYHALQAQFQRRFSDTAYSGKCDFGQGFATVQYQLLADELYVPLNRITLIACDTAARLEPRRPRGGDLGCPEDYFD